MQQFRWGPGVDEFLLVKTETIENEPGQVDFEMFQGAYAVEIQAGSSQVAGGITADFAEDEPCGQAGAGNSPHHTSFEVIFRRSD